MRLCHIFSLCLALIFWTPALYTQDGQKVHEVLQKAIRLEIPQSAYPVERTVAEAVAKTLSPEATVVEVSEREPIHKGSIRISVSRQIADSAAGWFRLKLLPDGTGELTASHTHFLYTGYCRIRDDWSDDPVKDYIQGRIASLRLPWLEGNDGFFAVLPRLARSYDPEATIKELARLGCTHVSVNVLSSPAAMEQGVPGEIYPRFYGGSPDLDQFVATDLTHDLYPAEYLAANLALLKNNAALAVKYGLTPGLTICSPRTMPEAFFARYPYLRGARVDHPFRSYRPRYTATLSHPLVRWHYAQLMRAMMKEVPQLGYLYLWTNDSGSGFEYTSTLYAGRNGGAYLIREWKSDSAIIRAAGENVVRYLRLLLGAASETKPDFRVITYLPSFGQEKEVILNGLVDRLDLCILPSDTASMSRLLRKQVLGRTSTRLFTAARVAANFVLGVPFPWLTHDRLSAAVAVGAQQFGVTFDPPSLTRFSINREVVRAFQSGSPATVDEIVELTARRWAGANEAPVLVKAWRLADQAVRSFPDVPLYGTSWAFPLYRHWVRPFVPNISAIPAADRAYYEQHMIATFNNPTLIDFAADALWLLIDRDQAASIVRTCDSLVWKPLDDAIDLLGASMRSGRLTPDASEALLDQHDRLKAVRCYFRTLRNVAAWIAAVHGYMASSSSAQKIEMGKAVRATIDDELRNTEALLQLWTTSRTEFMPVAAIGESWAMYGTNFGSLLQKKFELMKKHLDDAPAIDPNFMWHVGPECPVQPTDYLKY